MKNVLILIPARYDSSRFQGKPLSLIKNKSMIRWVAENMKETQFDYAVVTDDQRIEDEVKSFHGNVVRVDDLVPSGTERIAIAFERYYKNKQYDFVINVQGDEPLLKKEAILSLVDFHSRQSFDIATLVRRREWDADFSRPDVVKAVVTQGHQCLYFSRASIPYSREQKPIDWFQHVGVYSYKPEALLKFVKFPMSTLEDTEKLEQLRALENGLRIGAIEFNGNLVGVDSPEDIQKVEQFLNG